MRIVFAYVPFIFRSQHYFDKGKKFDFHNLYDDPRGLTGSEVSCFTIAKHMAKRGHDVSILTTCHNITEENDHWEGIRIIPMNTMHDIGVLGGDWDVVYSWNEIDALRFATHRNTLRMINLQINDFSHALPDFENYTDVFTSPSESHRHHVGGKSSCPEKWEVVPNGCDPNIYEDGHKVSGRVIYASSPDRGLHHLLQAWPQIKKSVPHAHLKIFYEISKWVEPHINAPPLNRDIEVISTRARWIKEAFKRLQNMDIEVVGSASRNDIAREFNEAEVLAYPCDTINYTEGFSVTLMEACASRTVPITTNVDALGEIYGSAVPMVYSPVGDRLEDWSKLVIQSLTDNTFRQNVISKATDLAGRYKWETVTDKVEKIIKERKR